MIHMQPDQALFLLQVELPTLKNEHGMTRRVIEAIPNDKDEYRPDPLSKTAMEIAWHIVATEQRFLRGIVAGAFDFAPIPRPASVKNAADMAAWYGQSFDKDFQALGTLSGEQLAKAIDFRGTFEMQAVAFLDFTIRHSIHHRGQLSTYLRAMGGKVPAIYGESYDSAEARKAAQAG